MQEKQIGFFERNLNVISFSSGEIERFNIWENFNWIYFSQDYNDAFIYFCTIYFDFQKK